MPPRSKSRRRASLPVAIKDEKTLAKRPVMLLVLGPHRSGTSLTARMLECLGAQNSCNLNPPNFANSSGYFEDWDIYQFNDTQLLPRLGRHWSTTRSMDWAAIGKAERSHLGLQALEILRRNYPLSRPLSVLKEPRINETLPFWLSLIEHAGFDVRTVCTVRDPVSVARSLRARDGFSIARGGILYLSAWLSVLPHLQDRSTAFVHYDEVLASPGKSLLAVARALALPIPNDFDLRVHDFSSSHLNPSMRHSVVHRDDVQLEPELLPATIDLYRALLDAAQSQNLRKTARFLSRTETFLSNISPLLADYDASNSASDAARAEADALRHQHTQLQEQLAAAHQSENSDLATRHSSLVTESEALRSERDTLAARVSALEADKADLATRHSSLVTESEDIRSAHSSISTLYSSLVAERDELATRHSSLVTALEELQGRHSALDSRLSTLTTEYSDLVARHSSIVTSYEAVVAERNAMLDGQDTLVARLSALEAEHSHLVADHSCLSTVMNESREHHSLLADLHSSLAAERDALSQERDSLKVSLAGLQAEYDSLHLKHSVFMDDFGNAARELELGKTQLAVKQDSLDAANRVAMARLKEAEVSMADQQQRLKILLSERESLGSRVAALEHEHAQVLRSLEMSNSRCDALQQSLDTRFEELATLAQELSRRHLQLAVASRKMRLTDGVTTSIGDMHTRESHDIGAHQHVSFDCYNAELASGSIAKLSVRLVLHYGKPGIAIFRDQEESVCPIRKWLESGRENGRPYMLLVVGDPSAHNWARNAGGSDFHTVSFLAKAMVETLARAQSPRTPDRQSGTATRGHWLPVAHALVTALSSLQPTFRFDGIQIEPSKLGARLARHIKLTGVSFAGAFARSLHFTLLRKGLTQTMVIPLDQTGTVFDVAEGTAPSLEVKLAARVCASGIVWAPVKAKSMSPLHTYWVKAMASALPSMSALSPGEAVPAKP
jgi:hypothetical protein